MIVEAILIASLSIPTSEGTHPHTIAQEYCSNKGGLMSYVDTGKNVEIICFDDPAKVVVVNTGD